MISPLNETIEIRQCPACFEQWDIESKVAAQWVRILRPEKVAHQSALGRLLEAMPVMDTAGYYAMWEDVFRAHVARDCPYPQLIKAMLDEQARGQDRVARFLNALGGDEQ